MIGGCVVVTGAGSIGPTGPCGSGRGRGGLGVVLGGVGDGSGSVMMGGGWLGDGCSETTGGRGWCDGNGRGDG